MERGGENGTVQRIFEKNASQGKSPSGSTHTHTKSHTFRYITRRERGFYGALHAHTQPDRSAPFHSSKGNRHVLTFTTAAHSSRIIAQAV